MMMERIITISLSERSIATLLNIVEQSVRDAEQELCEGLQHEDTSMIAASEATLRALDPIHRELARLGSTSAHQGETLNDTRCD